MGGPAGGAAGGVGGGASRESPQGGALSWGHRAAFSPRAREGFSKA